MLAICSDLDGTPDRHVYWEIMRFLNTTQSTSMGPGVGLEVGNSIHFRAIPPQFSYWDTDDVGREMVRSLIHSGHIDCLHSFGERIFTRYEAKGALDDLERHNCRLEVWVDHGSAITNFGPDIMAGRGDEPGNEAYHADLTTEYGIKYVCRGRTTSVVGQDSSGGVWAIFNRDHPSASGKTLLKEAAKRTLAWAGHAKYAMHKRNETLRPIMLRDGQPVYEFIRCNPHWGGVSSCDQGRHIGNVLTNAFFNRLVDRQGSCILYTHLGKIGNPSIPFDEKAVTAFRRLADEYSDGRILVTTTRRLLGYRRAAREVTFSSCLNEEELLIDINTKASDNWIGELSVADLSGMTFYVPESTKASVSIDGRHVMNLQTNPPDHTGRASVSLPRPSLEFPDA
jgi:hypothetical protein